MSRSARALVPLILTLLSAGRLPAAPPPDAASLFREESAEAVRRIKWKGPALSDETRFAVAASGLTAGAGVPWLRAEKKETRFAEAEFRRAAFAEARRADRAKEAFSLALSLLLDPPAGDAGARAEALGYLRPYETDVDTALIGVLQAPEKLPLLPRYQYAAMNALVLRASPRLLPLFLTLAEADDRFLRSRALVGLGILAYRAGGAVVPIKGLPTPLRENSISAVQGRMISEAVRKAARDKDARVRASAAVALVLAADEADLPLLMELTKDRAYLSTPAPSGEKGAREILFPVRYYASRWLARTGGEVDNGSGTFGGKELGKATRGGHNVTNDYGNGLRKDQAGLLPLLEGPL